MPYIQRFYNGHRKLLQGARRVRRLSVPANTPL
jgi:hypothetical protein